MKQLWQSISSGKASVVDVPAPGPGRGQILVRVGASLISAGTERSVVEFAEKSLVGKAMARPDLVRQLTDKAKREGWLSAIDAARTRLNSDMVLGYSNAGVVIGVGQGVRGFKVGDRVACAGGGFATHTEVARIPCNLAALIPSGPGLREVPFEEAAFATVAAIGLQGIRLAELRLGEVVAVIGLGLVGQLVVQLARASGCTVIGMDPNPDRCKLASRLGCALTANSDEEMAVIAAQASAGRGVDAVIITAATSSDGPVTLAAEIARDRATVVAVGAVGLNLPRKPYYMKELDFRVSRSYGPGRYDIEYEEKGRDYPVGYVRWTEGRNLEAVLQLLASNQLDFASLITHRFPIESAEKGYELISGKTGEPFLGVIITYPDDPSTSRRIDLYPPAVSANEPLASIRLGLIGAGNFATAVLLPAMKAAGEIEFRAICAAGGSNARAAGDRYRFAYCSSDSSELLRDESVNTIAICTRHSAHASQVVAALEAGKHVFCEKPLAVTEEELASVIDASDHNPGLLVVGYNRRFAPLAQRLRQFLAGAREPFMMHYRVNAGFIPRDHWTQDKEEGGGRVIGEVCHFIDFLSFTCGHPVAWVSGVGMPNVGRYCDDNIVATLGFEDGSVGSITYTANGDKSYSKERIEIFGQGKIAVLEDYRDLRMIHGGKKIGVTSRLRVDKGHRGEWEAFAAALRKGNPSPITLSELVNSTLAAIYLQRAIAEGTRYEIRSEEFISRTRAGSSQLEERAK